jgi:HEAT repeat protein
MEELIADLVGPDESAAEAAVSLLAQEGQAAKSALIGLLESPDPDRRWWAVRALAAMQDPETLCFRRALGDAEPEVRAAAALALAHHSDQDAIGALVTALDDRDNLVAVLAVNALTSIGGAAVPALLDAFEPATPGGRINILRALSELRDPRAIPLLMKSLGEGSTALHYWAQTGLERLGLDMVYLSPD